MNINDLPKTGMVCLLWSCRECRAKVAGGYYTLPRELQDMQSDVAERRHLSLRVVPAGEDVHVTRHTAECRVGKGELE